MTETHEQAVHSQNNSFSTKTSVYTRLAILTASAAALQLIETPIPRVLPWLKIGLANIITLYAILKFSSKAALTIAFFRTFIAAIFLGSFLSPIHFISLSGALSATIVMSIFLKLRKNSGLAIVSITGAIVNNASQL